MSYGFHGIVVNILVSPSILLFKRRTGNRTKVFYVFDGYYLWVKPSIMASNWERFATFLFLASVT